MTASCRVATLPGPDEQPIPHALWVNIDNLVQQDQNRWLELGITRAIFEDGWRGIWAAVSAWSAQSQYLFSHGWLGHLKMHRLVDAHETANGCEDCFARLNAIFVCERQQWPVVNPRAFQNDSAGRDGVVTVRPGTDCLAIDGVIHHAKGRRLQIGGAILLPWNVVEQEYAILLLLKELSPEMRYVKMNTVRKQSRELVTRPTKDAKRASTLQGHLVAMSGEFVGTFMFLFLAYCGHTMAVDQAPRDGTGPNGTKSASTVIYISLSYGFALLVTVWTMYRISGGLFNPAVTLGLIVTGNIPLMRGLLLLPVQIIASMAAAGAVSAITPGSIQTVQTTLTPTMSVAQGVFLEMFLTSFFIINILMLAAEKSKDTFIAPIGIGLTLFICEIAGVFYTGASLNPARSFGPCVAGRNFQHYHWIYWIVSLNLR
ncbi:hypothetical protein LTR87_016801 [Friedmanniomyces endolithicus]|nr:hypothetical protein LTR87_016801 [Friedmanniomyces endolithicus]